jgi:hypothetical protein
VEECSGPYGCGSGLLPISHLMWWDKEYGSKICESCNDEFKDRCNKE